MEIHVLKDDSISQAKAFLSNSSLLQLKQNLQFLEAELQATPEPPILSSVTGIKSPPVSARMSCQEHTAQKNRSVGTAQLVKWQTASVRVWVPPLSSKPMYKYQLWWYWLMIPVLEKWKQEDLRFTSQTSQTSSRSQKSCLRNQNGEWLKKTLEVDCWLLQWTQNRYKEEEEMAA